MRSLVPLAVCAAYAGIGLSPFCPPPAAAQTPPTYVLKSDDAVIYDLVGTVRVEPGGEGGVSVEVTPGGAAAARLKVAQGTVRGVEALRVLFPSERIRYPRMGESSETTLDVRDDGTFGGGASYHEHDADDRQADRHEGHDHDGGVGDRDADEPGADDADGGRGWSGRRVRITGGSGDEMWADLRIRVPEGRRLTLRVGVGEVAIGNVNGRIAVEAAAAPITAAGSRGTLALETGAGRIEVSRFSGERVTLETGSGDVAGTGVDAAEVRVETGSGSVRLGELKTPRAFVETGSGRVVVDLTGDVDRLRVQTGSGDVAISAPPSLGARVEFESGSGDIESEFPLTLTRTGRDGTIATVGDGKGAILVETGSGSLRLRKRAG